jgi:hypothetical protein
MNSIICADTTGGIKAGLERDGVQRGEHGPCNLADV